MARDLWPIDRKSSGANHRALRNWSAVFLLVSVVIQIHPCLAAAIVFR